MSSGSNTSTRSDAARNRTRILEIAEKYFAEHGLDVPMDTIARKAGVGAGTLYRHFPNRETLIASLIEDRVGDLRQTHCNLVTSEADAAKKLEEWLHAMRAWMRSYDGLPGPLRQAWEEGTTPLGLNCMEVINMTEELLREAQQHGLARSDLSARDLYLANIGAAWAASAPLADGSTNDVVANLISSGWRAAPQLSKE
jgi:AcrR family transcriptional regulator